MMPLLRNDSAVRGSCSLPPFRDLLNNVDPNEDGPMGLPLAVISMCPTCLSNGRRIPHTPGSPCIHCFPDQSLARHYHTAPNHSPQDPQPALFKPSPDYFVPRRPSHPCVTIKSEPPPPPTPPQPQPQSQPLPLPLRTSRLPISPFRLTRRPTSFPPAPNPRPNAAPLQALTPAKIASNDRHKLSEKHRRDGMGAFVQAGDVLRKGLSPGALLGCRLCMPPIRPAPPASLPDSGTSLSPLHGMANPPPPATFGAAPKPKKPKNNMLEEGLMWDFAWLLHVVPGRVQEHLDEIYRLAEQKARDKEYGMQNDWAKRKKWDADVRAEVLGQALRAMEAECERHGVVLGHAGSSARAGVDASAGAFNGSGQEGRMQEGPDRKRRRQKAGDGPTPPSSSGSPVLTPPSSSGSPLIDLLSSREASED